MNEVRTPLTQDEYRLLLVARESGELTAIGDRMTENLTKLYKRGLLAQQQNPHGFPFYVITHAGKLACDAEEDGEIAEIMSLNNRVVEQKQLVSKDLRPPSQDWDHSMRIAIAQLVGMIEAQAAATGRDPKSFVEPVIEEIRRQVHGA